MKTEIVVDRRDHGTTEMDARGKFLAPDGRVRICSVPQVDGGVRHIYAHTRAQAAEWRAAIKSDRALIDGLPSSVVAMIVDAYHD